MIERFASKKIIMVYLDFAETPRGDLIHVDDARQGLGHVTCPYCHAPVLPKRGDVIAWHFAHDKHSSCVSMSDATPRVVFPAFRHLMLRLTDGQRNALTLLWKAHQGKEFRHKGGYGSFKACCHRGKTRISGALDTFLEQKFLKYTYKDRYFEEDNRYLLTTKTALVNGAAEVAVFYDAIRKEIARRAACEDDVDRRLFDAAAARASTYHLYFVRCTLSDDRRVQKIGITSRTLPERIAEIKTMVNATDVTPLCWGESRSLCEQYVLFRFASSHLPLPPFTEFFDFRRKEASVVDELCRVDGVTRLI